MVVFSSALSYVILAKNQFQLPIFILLCLGGLLITFAANALNQGLERDYDKLMTRTALRPVADGRMSVSLAVLISGILCTTGVLLLSMINPGAAIFGMLSFISYAFIYTPLKRYSTIAIPVGAIPGALPTLIAGVAVSQGLTSEAFCLFGIQYLWQFPHFWSIAWLGHSDYKRAGFKLIKDVDGKPDPKYGLYSSVYSLLSLVFIFIFISTNQLHPFISCCLVISIIAYTLLGWNLYRKNNEAAARKLMFGSIIYLPLILFLFLINNFLL
jgi:protoheme IX farnesyltransferase